MIIYLCSLPRYDWFDGVVFYLVIVAVITILRFSEAGFLLLKSNVIEQQTILDDLTLLQEFLVFGYVSWLHRTAFAQNCF